MTLAGTAEGVTGSIHAHRPRRRPEIGWAAVGALALHAALVAPFRPQLITSLSAASPAMQVRVLAAENASATSEAARDVPPASAEPAILPPTVIERTPDTTARAEAASAPRPLRQDPPPAVAQATPATVQAAAPAAEAAPASPVAGRQAAIPGLPAAPDYLASAGLDPGPRPVDDIDPEYPPEGNLREGTVAIRLLISETGHVDNVAVVRSTPPGLFDRAAIAAFSAARFSPGMILGVPTKSQITVEVHFAPYNRGAKVSGRSY